MTKRPWAGAALHQRYYRQMREAQDRKDWTEANRIRRLYVIERDKATIERLKARVAEMEARQP